MLNSAVDDEVILANPAEKMGRQLRLARPAAALSHPNILALYDVGAHQGVSYAVTELLEGETLRARLAQSAIPWRRAVEIGTAVAEGLAAAHSKGIIHRDLKPHLSHFRRPRKDSRLRPGAMETESIGSD